MPKVVMFECYEVVACFEDEPAREMRPRGVWFDEYEQVVAPLKRALDLGCTVIINRHRVESFEHENDPDLNDWPAERHIVRQQQTPGGWKEIEK
jgi:hypothetical protein